MNTLFLVRVILWEFFVYGIQLAGFSFGLIVFYRHHKKLITYDASKACAQLRHWGSFWIRLGPIRSTCDWPQVRHVDDMARMVKLFQLLTSTVVIGYVLVLRTVWHLQFGWDENIPYGLMVAFLLLHVAIGAWGVLNSFIVWLAIHKHDIEKEGTDAPE